MNTTATSHELAGEKKTVATMIGIYCKGKHAREDLCAECSELLDYALTRLSKCPFGIDKPKCSKCHVHCYKPEMRDRIKEVMRYAGPRMMLKHPIMAIAHAARSIRK